MSAQSNWHYAWGGRVHGPVSWLEFEALMAEGLKPEKALLAREGDERWMTVEEARAAATVGPPAGAWGLPHAPGVAGQPQPASVLDGFGYWLSLGWEMLMTDIWAFIGATALMLLLSMVTFGILSAPMTVGLWMMCLAVHDGRPVRAGSVMAGFSRFWQALGLMIITWLIAALPMMLLAAPIVAIAVGMQKNEAFGALIPLVVFAGMPLIFVYVFFVSMALLFTWPLIADGRAGVIESIGASWHAVRPQFWAYLLVMFVLGAINGAGSQLCYVGMLVTTPYVSLVLTTLYRDRFPAGVGAAADAVHGGAA